MGDMPGRVVPASDAAKEAAAGAVQEGPVTDCIPPGCPVADDACGGCIADTPGPQHQLLWQTGHA